MSVVVLQLAIIFLPGLIWAKIFERYGATARFDQTELLIRAFMYGLISYLAVFLIYRGIGWQFYFIDIGAETNRPLQLGSFYNEIVASIPVSIILALSHLYLKTYKIFEQFLHRIKATKNMAMRMYGITRLTPTSHPWSTSTSAIGSTIKCIVAGLVCTRRAVSSASWCFGT